MGSEAAIGIDLGTNFSCVGVLQGGKVSFHKVFINDRSVALVLLIKHHLTRL